MSKSIRALILSVLLACASNPDSAVLPPGVDAAYLEIVGAERLTVSEGAEVALTVRYFDQDENPIAGNVSFAIEDEAGGASLSALNGATDSAGMATVNLRASAPANFIISAVAPAADPVIFDVQVVEGSAGDVLVTPIYEGDRLVADIDIALFTNSTCADLDATVPAPRNVERTRTWETVTFRAVDTAVPSAVYALGYNRSNAIAAARCLDVDFERGNEWTFELVDVATVQGGRFGTEETFDVTEGFPPALNFTLDALEGLSTDPGGYIVDMAIASGRLPGWAEAALGGARGLVSNLLEDAIARIHVPGYVNDLAAAGGGVNAAFTEVTLIGELDISEADEFSLGSATHRLTELRVPTGDGAYETRPLVGAPTDVDVTFDEAGINLAEHSMSVPFGEVVEVILNDVLIPRFPGEPTDMGDLLGSIVSCEGLAGLIPYDSELIRDAAEAACGIGLGYVGDMLEGWITDLFDYDTLTLAGVGSTADTDDDYAADEFEGTADATWSGSRGALDFPGTLAGARVGDLPERLVDRVRARMGAPD